MENNVEKIDLDHVDWKSSREFFESLGEALDKLDGKDEAYDFTWVGKRKSIIEAGAPINKTLRPDIEASKDFNNTKNMLIVGDNLDALKLLQESYLGKIKMIYIDPPYNTGHDFVYHDNFTIKKDDYADSSTGDDGVKLVSEDEFTENSKANGRFHSDWLSMMYPRLKVSRNLLSEEGVIFISIDNSEHSNLKKMCDEVFGEDNFVGNIARIMKSGGNKGQYFSPNMEYILVYAKNIVSLPFFREPLSDETKSTYNHTETTGPRTGEKFTIKGLCQPGLGVRPNQRYYVEAPDGTLIIPKGKTFPAIAKDGEKVLPSGDDFCWRWSQERYLQEKEKGIIYFSENKSATALVDQHGNTSKWNVYTKIYLSDREDEGRVPTDLISKWENRISSEELKQLQIPFDFAKPTAVIRYLSTICGTSNDDIILDFFAGSGSTAHSIMQQNMEDGSKRRFILVQLNELVNPKSEAGKSGYETVDQITAERLRRAGDAISKEVEIAAPFERAEKETGIAATFIDDETKAYGKAEAAKLDTGFRVFRIDDSNEKDDIRKPLGEIQQSNIFDMVDNVKTDRTPLDLLFGVVYASALPFDLKLETRKIGDNTVYLYGYLDEGTGLVACFDDKVPEDTIKEIAELKALTAAFKDSSFADSAEKINLSEHFRIISPDTKVKVI